MDPLFRSEADVDEGCCVSREFQVPQATIQRALEQLDTATSPGHPGSLRESELLEALWRFDATFDIGRSDMDRVRIANDLERSSADWTLLNWQSTRLFKAFRARLTLPERIYFTLDVSDSSSVTSRLVSMTMVFLILLSIGVWIASTMPEVSVVLCAGCDPTPPDWMEKVDFVCISAFTIEYLLRLVTVPMVRIQLLHSAYLVSLISAEHGQGPDTGARGLRNLFKFARSPSALCDLVTVLPYWLEMIFEGKGGNFMWLRFFRILRVSRAFKLLRLVACDFGHLEEVRGLLSTITLQAFPAFCMIVMLVAGALVVFYVAAPS